MIPLSIPYIAGNEWKYIKECLDTGWVSSVGSFVTRFEKEIAEYTGAKHAIACVNGTSALHISLLLAGVKVDDEVLTPTLTFIATANAINYCGAHPVFMDCEAEHLTIDVAKVEKFLEEGCQQKDGDLVNKKTGRRVSAILPVHVFGYPCDMDRIMAIAGKYNLKVVEDSTESLGSKIGDRHCGTIADIGCLSFNGNKIITTGGGGMILTNNDDYAKRAKYLTQQAKEDGVGYIHDEVGFNYRMTNLQAAMGVAQLENLSKIIEIKRKNASLYRSKLGDIGNISFMQEDGEGVTSNHWLYFIRLDDKISKGKDDLLKKMNENGCETRPIWQLCHRQKPYRDCDAFEIKNATDAFDMILNIPSAVQITSGDIEKTVKLIKDWIE